MAPILTRHSHLAVTNEDGLEFCRVLVITAGEISMPGLALAYIYKPVTDRSWSLGSISSEFTVLEYSTPLDHFREAKESGRLVQLRMHQLFDRAERVEFSWRPSH